MRLPPAIQRSVKRLAAATRSDRADLLTLAAIAIAVVWANISPRSYREVWKATTVWSRPLGLELSVQDWVSQGLMVAFFMLVGLEIRREIANGQLRSWRRASVPIVAAICGMALPAAIYALVVGGSAGGHGWGIPMATDVAFALGALGLVQPGSSRLRVFLLTLAVADDIASILILVFVYSHHLHTSMLVLSLGCLGTMAALSALGIRRVWPLIVLGPLAWWALARAGVEPAVVGVAIGLVVPTPTGHGARALKGLDPGPGRLELALEPWVNVLVLPAFALANAGIPLAGSGLGSKVALRVFAAVVVARVIGKPLGIALGQRAASLFSSQDHRWEIPFRHEVGLGAVAGIGLTIPLLIIRTALPDGPLANAAIAGLLAASILSVLSGTLLLRGEAQTRRPPRFSQSDIRVSGDGSKSLSAHPEPRPWLRTGMVVSSLVAGVDALLGPRLVLIGLLIAGPSCTLLSRRLKPTLASGAWAVALAVVLGIPDGIWASYEHLAFVSAVVVSAAVNVSVARVLEKLAARQSQTHYGSGNNSITER